MNKNLLVLMAFLSVPLAAQVGQSASSPIKFEDIRYWINDVRPSLQLLEQTLRTDMLGTRSQLKWSTSPRWIKLQNQTPRETTLYHFTFQGIFWAPVFSALVWTPPALLADTIMAMSDSSWEYLTTAAVWSTVFVTSKANQENTFADLIKLNVVYVADVLGLAQVNADELWLDSNTTLSRSYAGLAFKILDTNYFFAGYSFVDMPYLEGWGAYVNEIGSSSSKQVFVYSDDHFSTGELFFYNNYADLLSVSALVDWGTEALIKFLGLGLYLNFFDILRPDIYFNYIQALSKYSLDTLGDIKVTDWLYLHWKWYLPLNEWKPLSDFRAGLTLVLANREKVVGLGLRGDYITYLRGDEQKHGFFAEFGFYFPASARLVAGASLNAGDTIKRLPMAEDVYVYHVRLEIGMDNNFDGRFRLRAKDLMGYKVGE